MKAAPYTASIDRALLKNLIYMGKCKTIAPGATAASITNDPVKAYIESILKRSTSHFDHVLIKRALSTQTFPSNIVDPYARITHYCSDFFERLEGIGCGEFRNKNPKQTSVLLLRKVKPFGIKDKMNRRIQFDESRATDIPRLIEQLSEEAKACQIYDGTGGRSPTFKKGQSSAKQPSKSESLGSTSGTKSKKEKPLCLWPEHQKQGLRHHVKDCRDCPSEKKVKLIEEFKKTLRNEEKIRQEDLSIQTQKVK